MINKKILIPLPTYGFDPTEVAVPWKILKNNNIDIVFATPSGEKGNADKLMIDGNGLGIWKSMLRATKDAIGAYKELEISHEFCNPLKYCEINECDFDGIYLPGGHDKAVKEYLESQILQRLVVDFFSSNKPVGAICHGVILLARSIDPATNKSVISDYKTTCLLKTQEMLAYKLTKLWLDDYYLTYPGMTVEDEVKSILSDVNNFIKGPLPVFRDSIKNINRGFCVSDRNYLSARWPGDIYNFSHSFLKLITKTA